VSLERIVVVGDSGSGKSVLSRELHSRLGHPLVELDQLHWAPSWTPRPQDAFQRDVGAATVGPRWIVDGNYRRVIDLVWGRATDLVWLDYPLAFVFARGLLRSVRRSLSREPLWAGNRESLRRTFWSHDSILLWILTSRTPRRRRYREILERGRFPELRVHRLDSPRRTEEWLAALAGSS
jgi:adenylate kinase family enzyme